MPLTRRRFLTSSAAAAAVITPALRVRGAHNDIRVAILGLGGKGSQHRKMFTAIEGVRVTGLCDPDQARLDAAVKAQGTPVTAHQDLRRILDDKDIDAVCVATCNHWHALAAVWAMQSGKDVYVEKPVSYDLWEGRQLVAAARKYNRIVQGGTQRRSDAGYRELREYLKSRELGKILRTRVLHYSLREGIGRRDTPLPPPATLDLNLWSGPAPIAATHRSNFHYDWHWFWDTGNGELGNNGPHALDLVRWMLGYDHLPEGVQSIGGRYVWQDAGETPNTQIVFYDYRPAPIIAEVRNLPSKTGVKGSDVLLGTRTGFVIECEGGHVTGLNGSTAFDREGRKIRSFRGDNGESHPANFIQAVRSRNPSDLNCEIAEGHLSTALCHIGNVSHRLGRQNPPGETREKIRQNPLTLDAFDRMLEHVRANDTDPDRETPVLGPALRFDPAHEKFISTPDAQAANALCRRTYREPFTVPENL